MFVLSLKLNLKKVLTTALVIFMIAIVVSVTFQFADTVKSSMFNNILNGQSTFQFKNIKTNEDRIDFLKQFGWEVEGLPVEIVEVQLPEEFDQVYINYNEYQKEIGLDLRKYRGKRAKRYTYRIINYPEPIEDDVRANILVYKNRVIAGDIMTIPIGGFMHSLLYKVGEQ